MGDYFPPRVPRFAPRSKIAARRHPPLALRPPCGAGPVAPGLSITIEAAIGAVRNDRS